MLTLKEKPNFFKSLFFAFRPKTLFVSLSPIYIGNFLAFKDKPDLFIFKYALFAFLSAICIQIGTNLFNDVLDFKKGTDNLNRLGPSRVTQNGWMTSGQVTFGAVLFFVFAICFGLPLVLKAGVPLLILGIFSLLCGYLYTGGPFPLAYKGLGELFVLIFFGFAAVCGSYFIQIGSLNFNVLIASFQIGLLACSLISINNYRDFENDKLCGKMTLSARFGKLFSKIEISLFFLIPYILNFYWILNENNWNYAFCFLLLPMALAIIRFIVSEEPSEKFNKYLGLASLHQLLFSVLLFH